MAAKITLKLKGVSELNKALKAAGERAVKLGAAALHEEAEEIMTVSKERYCPVESGNLMNSGHVQLPEIKGNRVTVTLGYGGPAADYAEAVHENLSSKVHWSKPGSGPKYLEKAIVEATPGMGGRLASRIKAGL